MKKILTTIFSALIAVVAMGADTLSVKSVLLAGPYDIHQPVLVDSVNNAGDKWSDSNMLAYRLPMKNAVAATLPAKVKAEQMAQVQFVMQTRTHAEGSLKVSGAKECKVYVDGEELTGGMTFTKDPGDYKVDVLFLGDANALTVDVCVDKGLVALPSMGVAGTGAGKRQVTLNDIICQKVIRSASISPSGRWAIIASSYYDEKYKYQYEAVLQDLRTGRESVITKGDDWMPKTDRYYYTTEVNGTTQLIAVNPETGATETIVEDLPSKHFQIAPTEDYLIVSVSKDGPKKDDEVYEIIHPDDRQPDWRQRTQYYRYDLRSGAYEPLIYGSHNMAVNDISADGRYLLYSVVEDSLTQRPTTRSSYYRLDMTTRQSKKIIDKDGFIGYAGFLGSADRIYVNATPEAFGGIANIVPEGMTPSMYDYHLYMLDIPTGKVAPLTTADNTSISSVEYNHRDGMLYYSAERADSVLLYRLDLKTLKSHKVQQPLECLTGFSLSKTSDIMLVYGSDAMKPYRTYSLNTRNMQSKLLYYPERKKWEEDVQLGTLHTFTLHSDRGYDVPCFYQLPPDFDASKKYPVIVHYYGGCSPTSRRFGGGTHYPLLYWNSLGYITLIVNPSGAAGFGQEWAARHVNTMGEGPAQDIIDATRQFAKEVQGVDADHIGCVSASYGGFMTQYMMTKDNPFACGISHAGISSHTSYWGEGYWGYSYSEVSAANSYPWTRKDLFVDRSPLYNADKISKPILFTHGTVDTNVPIGESIQMYNALKLLGVPTAFIQVKGENHGIMNPQKRIKWINSMMAWFQRWLKDDASWWQSMYPVKAEL